MWEAKSGRAREGVYSRFGVSGKAARRKARVTWHLVKSGQRLGRWSAPPSPGRLLARAQPGFPPFPGPGYQPCDPQVICNRVNHVHGCLAELQEQAARRRAELEASRSLWALLQELEEAESWARDKERLLEAAGGGGAGAAGAAGAAGGAHDLSRTARPPARPGRLGGRRPAHRRARRGRGPLGGPRPGPWRCSQVPEPRGVFKCWLRSLKRARRRAGRFVFAKQSMKRE